MKYLQKNGRQEDSMTYYSDTAMLYITRTQQRKRQKVVSFSSLKQGGLGIAPNYHGITLTSIATKIYNAPLHNRIEPEIEKILRKNQNGFGESDPHHRFGQSTESFVQKTLLLVDFSKAFDSIHRGKMEPILLAYGLPIETVTAIMMLYKTRK